jgi:hypothetical protein
MIQGFSDEGLAVSEETSSLVASCQIIICDNVVGSLKNNPVFFIVSTLGMKSRLLLHLLKQRVYGLVKYLYPQCLYIKLFQGYLHVHERLV